MRSDFQKLLCECYKEGRAYATSSGNLRRRRKQVYIDEDSCSSVNVAENILRKNTKSFGENLAPLQRYIEKQVGRPWNKVYADICQHNSKAGAVGLHIFQHLYWYIYTNVNKDEKKRIFQKVGGVGRGYRDEEIPFDSLYVDPVDNIIKRYRKNKRKDKTAAQRQSIRIDELHTIEKENGIWHFYSWRETPRLAQLRKSQDGEALHYDTVYCLKRKSKVSFPTAKVYAMHKRQLNKRELKIHSIANEYGTNQ